MDNRFENLGLIMGSNRFNLENLDDFKEKKVETKYGMVSLLIGTKCAILSRHGVYGNIPPHRINHRANMLAFSKTGFDKIISFTSVGSLKLELSPTQIIMPDDYINTGSILTYFDDKIKHVVPELNEELRGAIISKIRMLPIDFTFNGIYIQTQGPRLETKAEINMYKGYGDVVGMTMASEATLAKELGIKYANLSIIDNYCNGIVDSPLTIEAITKNQKKNIKNIERIISKILKLE
jgi:purine nucleoside phosphorylase